MLELQNVCYKKFVTKCECSILVEMFLNRSDLISEQTADKIIRKILVLQINSVIADLRSKHKLYAIEQLLFKDLSLFMFRQINGLNPAFFFKIFYFKLSLFRYIIQDAYQHYIYKMFQYFQSIINNLSCSSLLG